MTSTPNSTPADLQDSQPQITVIRTPFISNPLYKYEARARWANESVAKYGPTPEIALERLHKWLDENKVTFTDGSSALVVDGIIKLSAAVALVLHVALGMFFAVIVIAPDFLEVAARYWGIR